MRTLRPVASKVLRGSVAAAIAASACGPPEVYDVPPGEVHALRLPPPVPAVPTWAVSTRRAMSAADVEALGDAAGVAVAAPVRVRRVRVQGPGGSRVLRVGAVEPLRFRAVAPPATRSADFVWIALLEGQAVVAFEAARAIGLEGTEKVVMGGASLRVGALADNGTPNVVDVLVDSRTGAALGLRRARMAIVGARTGVSIESLGRTLRRTVRGARLRRIRPPSGERTASAPRAVAAPTAVSLEALNFRVLKNGFIDPDDAWVEANIVEAPVPVVGTVTCHRVMVPQLRAALAEIERRGLASLLRPRDYGGCWVPRFIDRDPSKPLSMHAFGLAVDLNVSTNRLGTRGDMDARVVAVFERWGFEWGGRWARPDPMHFELARIVND